ncbi:MAG: hypothetical protein NVV63_12520 [Opitutus sp.]|nr:hypothetical protein [Opitutus sp.]
MNPKFANAHCFLRMLALDRLLKRDAKGVVTPTQDITPLPPWLLPAIKAAHEGSGPDRVVLYIIKEAALAFYTIACVQNLPLGTTIGEAEEAAIEEVRRCFSDYISNDRDRRRWLMWGNGKHWTYLDAALVEVAEEGCRSLEDLIDRAAGIQAEEVTRRLIEFFDDEEARNELAASIEEAEAAVRETDAAENEGMKSVDS